MDMRTRGFVQAGLILGLYLLAAWPALAKGPPDKVTISGPGMAETVEITDPVVLEAFSFFQFEQVDENQRRGIPAPQAVGAGYHIVRYVGAQAWDELHYYPNSDGTRGVIFLDGLIGDSATEFDGRWYHASAAGDQAMRNLFNTLNIRPTLPVTGAEAGRSGALLGLATLLVLAGYLLQRRYTSGVRLHENGG